MDEWTSKRNYQIEIVDESVSANQTLEKFYETDLFEYYFNSAKSDKVYAIINGTEKYLVKDLLNNNPTDYVISIDNLERAGLEFIKKEKYPKINITVQGENLGFEEKIVNENIFDIGYGEQGSGINESTFELYIIPKTSGKTNLIIDVIDYTNNKIVETREYIITVNENLEVEYEEK